jgi:1-deoxy-D-xylulose-5-phosphate reductoisomerase
MSSLPSSDASASESPAADLSTAGSSVTPPGAGPRGLAVLGSTGSIGTQTLDVVRLFPDRFRVRSLTCGRNIDRLEAQAREFAPNCVVVGDENRAAVLRDRLARTDVEVLAGEPGLCEGAARDDVDVVMAAIVGAAGLAPVLAALRAGKRVALANKETLVIAGALVNRLLDDTNATLIPVDSEHSAIYQCLAGESAERVEEIILTASGGPFRTRDPDTFDQITVQEALDHPNWSMGAKITIDSATLMNKGLEVIEAHWLFGLPPEQIRVLVHPQSIVHSMVAFDDGSIKAELGVPDMKVPIQYALSVPERWAAPHERLSWRDVTRLDFEPPNLDAFPCLRLAFDALEHGGTAPAVLNAANEEAVSLFLNEAIGFLDIPRLVEAALGRTSSAEARSLDALREADAAARRCVQELTLPAAN